MTILLVLIQLALRVGSGICMGWYTSILRHSYIYYAILSLQVPEEDEDEEGEDEMEDNQDDNQVRIRDIKG